MTHFLYNNEFIISETFPEAGFILQPGKTSQLLPLIHSETETECHI